MGLLQLGQFIVGGVHDVLRGLASLPPPRPAPPASDPRRPWLARAPSVPAWREPAPAQDSAQLSGPGSCIARHASNARSLLPERARRAPSARSPLRVETAARPSEPVNSAWRAFSASRVRSTSRSLPTILPALALALHAVRRSLPGCRTAAAAHRDRPGPVPRPPGPARGRPRASRTAFKRVSRRRTRSSSRARPAASSRSTRARPAMTCPNLVACSAARASSRCRSASYEMAARRSAIVVRSRSATARAPVAVSCSSRATPNVRWRSARSSFAWPWASAAGASRTPRPTARSSELRRPGKGLHRHLGGSPSLPHLRQPLRRGIGVVPLEQAGQHLGLGVGVGGDRDWPRCWIAP